MICAWYERQLKDDRNELWRDGVPTQALISHARHCQVCEAFVAREMELQPLLAELAEQSRGAEPSGTVKAELLAALEERRPRAVERASWIPRVALAMAAVICLVVAIAMFRRPEKVVGPTVVTPALSAKSPEKGGAPTITEQMAKPAVVATKHAVKARQPRGQVVSASSSTDFLPTVMCDELTCAGPATTVRVELPASPLVANGDGRTITADLLVGEDGLVRGIRVLQ